MRPTTPLTVLSSLLIGCTITVPNPLPSAAMPPAVTSSTTGGATAANAQPGSTSPAKAVTAVRLTPDTAVIATGSAKDFSASVTYGDGSVDGAVAWTSSDDTILTVNATTGRATGVKAGVASVVAAAIASPGRKATATVTVRAGEVVDAILTIAPTEATLKVGETVRLQAKSQQSDGGVSPNVVWTSDNKAVALVSNGLVTAVGPGRTTVTAMAAGDSTKQVSCTITVVSP